MLRNIITKSNITRNITKYSYSSCVGTNVTDGKINLFDVDKEEIGKDYFQNKKVVVFGLPGAFTPVCTTRMVPEYIEKSDSIKSKGVDAIACVSVNDSFCMDAWAKTFENNEKLDFLADFTCGFTKNLGVEIDLSAATLGTRSTRYSMIVDNGKVTHCNVENAPNDYEVSTPDVILGQLN
eukprot:TRINITY_DN136760_c0_g1_i1.p1 TRINITY_DN136760_c0_g1~~TRINITY_DN136760_c0_g1_i1.p1  ORF type:complete len:180 (-),score=38.12 TRINITY_DN136760_c0_g1_i1:82-621(-)